MSNTFAACPRQGGQILIPRLQKRGQPGPQKLPTHSFLLLLFFLSEKEKQTVNSSCLNTD